MRCRMDIRCRRDIRIPGVRSGEGECQEVRKRRGVRRGVRRKMIGRGSGEILDSGAEVLELVVGQLDNMFGIFYFGLEMLEKEFMRDAVPTKFTVDQTGIAFL